jgi:hypothetical protein
MGCFKTIGYAQLCLIFQGACAKRRLSDEYDGAQERGEVAKHGGGRNFKVPDRNVEPSAADIGLTRKQIHESRAVRDVLPIVPIPLRHFPCQPIEIGTGHGFPVNDHRLSLTCRFDT